MSSSFCFRLSRALLCVFCLVSGFSVSINAQNATSLPMKSLTVGNRWVYNNYGYQPEYMSFADQWSRTRILEIVIGDTTIKGKLYGTIYNSYDKSLRFERSDSVSVFAWNETTGESIVHRWNLDTTKLISWPGWLIYNKQNFSPVGTSATPDYSINNVQKTDSTLSFGNNSQSFLPNINRSSFAADYQRSVGVVRVNKSADPWSFRLSYNYTTRITGSLIDNQVRGDTSFQIPIPLLLSVTSQVLSASPNDTVTISTIIKLNNRDYPNILYSNGITHATAIVSFNASILKPIANTPLGTVSEGIRSIPLPFVIPQYDGESVKIHSLFRITVGNDTIIVVTVKLNTILLSWLSPPKQTSSTIQIATNRAVGTLRFFSPRAQILVANINPNPVSDILDIRVTAEQPATVEGVVSNTLGIPVLTIKPTTIASGRQTLTFPVEHLPSGYYHLTLRSHNETIQRQFIIIH
jgi:hypothetical protein